MRRAAQFLRVPRAATQQATACVRCRVNGAVHEFLPQRSEAYRKQQKMHKPLATPATVLSSEQGESQCSSSQKASLSAIS
jgi:hypothetical protein